MTGRSQTGELSVALQYDGESPPRVSAKGRRLLAREIQDLAMEHGIPVHEDPELAQFLARLEVGETVPRELYVAVAEVIAFAYWLAGKAPDQYAER